MAFVAVPAAVAPPAPYRPNETMTAVDTARDLSDRCRPVRDDRAKVRGSKEPADPLARLQGPQPVAACGGRASTKTRFLDVACGTAQLNRHPTRAESGLNRARDAARGAEQPAPRIHEGRIR